MSSSNIGVLGIRLMVLPFVWVSFAGMSEDFLLEKVLVLSSVVTTSVGIKPSIEFFLATFPISGVSCLQDLLEECCGFSVKLISSSWLVSE